MGLKLLVPAETQSCRLPQVSSGWVENETIIELCESALTNTYPTGHAPFIVMCILPIDSLVNVYKPVALSVMYCSSNPVVALKRTPVLLLE